MTQVYCCTCEKNIDEETLIACFPGSDPACPFCGNDDFLDAEENDSWKETVSPEVKKLIELNDHMEAILKEDPNRCVEIVEGF